MASLDRQRQLRHVLQTKVDQHLNLLLAQLIHDVGGRGQQLAVLVSHKSILREKVFKLFQIVTSSKLFSQLWQIRTTDDPEAGQRFDLVEETMLGGRLDDLTSLGQCSVNVEEK